MPPPQRPRACARRAWRGGTKHSHSCSGRPGSSLRVHRRTARRAPPAVVRSPTVLQPRLSPLPKPPCLLSRAACNPWSAISLAHPLIHLAPPPPRWRPRTEPLLPTLLTNTLVNSAPACVECSACWLPPANARTHSRLPALVHAPALVYVPARAIAIARVHVLRLSALRCCFLQPHDAFTAFPVYLRFPPRATARHSPPLPTLPPGHSPQ